jgi:hypothetical protein
MSIETLINNPLLLLLIAVWVLPWKGAALWKAAQRKDMWWFIAILVLNTLGIIEILYVFIWSNRRSLQKKEGNLS